MNVYSERASAHLWAESGEKLPRMLLRHETPETATPNLHMHMSALMRVSWCLSESRGSLELKKNKKKINGSSTSSARPSERPGLSDNAISSVFAKIWQYDF